MFVELLFVAPDARLSQSLLASPERVGQGPGIGGAALSEQN